MMFLPRSRLEVVGAFAADGQNLDRLAVGDQPLCVGTCELRDVRVEAAAKTALCRHDDQKLNLILAGTDEQGRCARLVGDLRSEAAEHRRHPLGVGPRGLCRFLCTAELRRGDHLHRLRNLPRRLHRGDAVAHVF